MTAAAMAPDPPIPWALWNGPPAVAPALTVMREAAQWLIERQQPLWRVEDLTAAHVLRTASAEQCWCLHRDGQPVAAMLLTWHDPDFWPDVPAGTSGFVHKLAVARSAHGIGLSQLMLSWAATLCRSRGLQAVRLDCAADRPALCRIYRAAGFAQVERRFIGTFDTAFFLKPLA